MEFTRRTYRKAFKRASKREYQSFLVGMKYRGRDPWIDAMRFSEALYRRAIREKKI